MRAQAALGGGGDVTARGARVAGFGSSVPAPVGQDALWKGFYARRCGDDARARRLWQGAGVRARHLVADPLVEDVGEWGTGARMERFLDEALPLAKQAVTQALVDAGASPDELGMLAVVSCTGYGNPGLDVRLATDLALPPDMRRLAIGHMGCYAALPGLATVTDYVTAHRRPAVLLCAELTSVHMQSPPHSTEQLVAHALFADATAAAVLVPSEQVDARSGLDVLDVATVTDTANSTQMTWDVTDKGFRMGLSAGVPDSVSRHVGGLVDALLARHGLSRPDVTHWAVHPGGPRIVDAVQEQLDLGDADVATSRRVLADYGNCSSATVLLVLERMRPVPGELVVALAFGPGLTIAGALLRAR